MEEGQDDSDTLDSSEDTQGDTDLLETTTQPVNTTIQHSICNNKKNYREMEEIHLLLRLRHGGNAILRAAQAEEEAEVS